MQMGTDWMSDTNHHAYEIISRKILYAAYRMLDNAYLLNHINTKIKQI